MLPLFFSAPGTTANRCAVDSLLEQIDPLLLPNPPPHAIAACHGLKLLGGHTFDSLLSEASELQAAGQGSYAVRRTLALFADARREPDRAARYNKFFDVLAAASLQDISQIEEALFPHNFATVCQAMEGEAFHLGSPLIGYMSKDYQAMYRLKEAQLGVAAHRNLTEVLRWTSEAAASSSLRGWGNIKLDQFADILIFDLVPSVRHYLTTVTSSCALTEAAQQHVHRAKPFIHLISAMVKTRSEVEDVAAALSRSTLSARRLTELDASTGEMGAGGGPLTTLMDVIQAPNTTTAVAVARKLWSQPIEKLDFATLYAPSEVAAFVLKACH